MSHFTKISTKLVELEYIKLALANLGFEFQTKGNVRGYQGGQTHADLRIMNASPGYDIGFVKCGDHIELIADWWGLQNFKQDEFLSNLTRTYAHVATRKQLETEGFSLVQEEQVDGTIHMLLRRMT